MKISLGDILHGFGVAKPGEWVDGKLCIGKADDGTCLFIQNGGVFVRDAGGWREIGGGE